MPEKIPVTDPYSLRQAGKFDVNCIPSVDVSEYFLVAPLTLKQISLFYYNLFAVITRAEINTQETRTQQEDDLRLASYDVILRTPPRERNCAGAVSEGGVSSVFPEDYYEEGDGYYVVGAGVSTQWNVIKMYNGSVTDVNNFLGYGISGEFAYAGAFEDGGDGRVGNLKVLTSYCKFDPNPDEPYELGSEEDLWFQGFSLLGLSSCNAEEVSLPVTGKDFFFDNFPFIQLSWDQLSILGDSEISSIELYNYEFESPSNITTEDDGPPIDERPLVDIPIVYQVLYMEAAYGAFGGFLGYFPYPTNYNPVDRIEYESILYAEQKGIELYGSDETATAARKAAFGVFQKDFFSSRNFYDINKFEEDGYGLPPQLPYYDGFVNTGLFVPTNPG